MKRLVLGLMFSLGMFALAGTAHAANDACFNWDCNDSTHVCTFDASCSVTNVGSFWRYRWDFGDGSSVVLTGSPTTSHSYSIPYPTVNLTLVFLDVDWVGTTCDIVVWNNVGPAQATYGRCT
jgi:PKD domain